MEIIINNPKEFLILFGAAFICCFMFYSALVSGEVQER